MLPFTPLKVLKIHNEVVMAMPRDPLPFPPSGEDRVNILRKKFYNRVINTIETIIIKPLQKIYDLPTTSREVKDTITTT